MPKYVMNGFVLLNEKGQQQTWSPKEANLLAKFCTIHQTQGSEEEMRKAMKNKGWSIVPATTTVKWKLGKFI